ncbi:MAG TPA: D,D-heptose 1,7-bisphosphate phosphatase, partial [Geobacter sulfurreducens]|nr:D,D-heptose 1,7-bisphosphate phosphatase [Geobacter sulfurreducens]
NQSGVARGYYDEEAVHRLHRFMDAELAKDGAFVDAYYLCPHHPHHGVGPYRIECSCRKPLPGMLTGAARDMDIDLARSYLIGDKMSDVEAGLAAGCTSLLVLTGYGDDECPRVPAGVLVCADILAATRRVIELEGDSV